MMGSKYLPPTPRVDLTGKKFGRLMVVGVSQKKKWGKLSWDCVCDCTKKVSWNTVQLNNNSKQSCGCSAISETDARATWRRIKGLPLGKKYEVSDTGKVRHAVTKKVLTKSVAAGAYIQYQLGRKSDGKTVRRYAHRLVATAFIGDCTGMDVNHLNGVKDDNRLENLEICTRSENHRHAFRVLGRKVHNIKLSKEQGRLIRKEIEAGVTQRSLARKYGVSNMVISRIKHRIQKEYL